MSETVSLPVSRMQQFEAAMEALELALETELEDAPEVRRVLHQTACASGEEEDSAELLAGLLGIDMQTVASTGRIARVGSPSGRAVAVRAELDALPIKEATGIEWKSDNGNMHACGHDVHQAALVALVRAAKSCREILPVALVPVLQPREEAYPSGAQDIVESGALVELDVAAVIGAHVHPAVETGEVAIGFGPVNAAADTVDIRFRGGGGHGAYPHEAKNPVLAMSHTVIGLEGLVARKISPMHPAVISVGKFRAGGASNVVPESGSLSMTVRTMYAEDRELLLSEIHNVAENSAQRYGLRIEVTVTRGEPVLENTPALVAEFNKYVIASGRTVAEPMRSCGSDDFSFYSEHFYSLMSFVGVETASVDPQPSLHHAQFLPTDRAVADVARALLLQYRAAALVIVAEQQRSAMEETDV